MGHGREKSEREKSINRGRTKGTVDRWPPADTVVCKRCGGEGTDGTDIVIVYSDDEFGFMLPKDCPECHGTGVVERSRQ